MWKGAFDFFNIHSSAKYQKNEEEPLGEIEAFPQKKRKVRILKSLIVPKNLKGGTLWNFSESILLGKVQKNEG